MTQRSKLRNSFKDAVADVADGSTIAFSGFAMPGTPFNLIKALIADTAGNLRFHRSQRNFGPVI